MADGYFLPTGDPGIFVATEQTQGPCEPGIQHAGPPAALLARAVEHAPSEARGPTQVARFTVEVMGPVPIGEVGVRAHLVRPGRSVELVEAELTAGGRAAMRARAWRIRTTELDLPPWPDIPGPEPLPPLPETATAFREPWMKTGFVDSVEWRFVSGSFETPGPSAAWARHRLPLVAGEEPTGLQRLVPFADCGNGLSLVYDVAAWWFINTDLTVHLHRTPIGEWIGIRASSAVDRSGVALAETELFDAGGRLGRGAQALLVGPR